MRSGHWRQAGRKVAALSLFVAASLLTLLFWALPCLASSVRVKYEETLDEVPVTEATEIEIKAAFLLRFPDFVDWPDSPDTLHIGVIDDDALLDMLTRLAEQENHRAGATQFLSVFPITELSELRRCEIVVMGDAAPPVPSDQAGTLTVGVWDEPRDGSIIRLFREGDRVRFDISQALAKQAGLRISSKLLNLSRQQTERSHG